VSSTLRSRSLLVLLGCLALLAAALPAAATAADSPLHDGDFAGQVGIGHGRSIYMECHGEGTPTVILDAGLRSRSDFWSVQADADTPTPTVLPGIARFTRVCAYDRPGTTLGNEEFSRSTPVPMPRTASDAANDLERLIKAAKLPGPYVLVGHSTGGLIIRLFASEHPRGVAGMVLVDALSEFLQGPLDPAQIATLDEVNNGPLPGLEGYTDLEQILFRPSFAEMRAADAKRPLAPMPLTVISRGIPLELPEGLPAGLTTATFNSAWNLSQGKLAELLPDARHVIAEQSSHYVMFSQPELIINEVKRVVDAVEKRDRP
jgi:pimeloyl-ACP methyl ester carboxylesterase